MLTKLQQFYNEQAEKFSGTRKKSRPEFDLILEQIENYIALQNSNSKVSPAGGGLKGVNILELGCGDGRFYRYLKETLCHSCEGRNPVDKKVPFTYTGVDFSQGLLDIAQKESPDGNRVCEDMLQFLTKQGQEEYDLIVSVASIQHIETKQNRNLLFRLVHRTLKYGGKHISINRAMSDIFKRKFKKNIKKSLFKRIFTLGNWDKNNIFVPFKTKNKTYQRLYHIFTIDEIKKLTTKNGLILSDCFFVGRDGDKVEKKSSRNTFFIQTKNIFK